VGDKPLPTVIEAEYLAEVRERSQVPALGPTEIAISGRSNVGKSTLLNRLSGRKSLARTSKTPGRTRGLIFYELAVRFPGARDVTPLRLVDLPGYGYAQVSQTERKSWQRLVEGYVERRPTLKLFLVLVDARRPVEPEEAQLIEWLATVNIPAQLVITKVDKLSTAERGAVRARARAALGDAAPPVAMVSGETGEGVDRLWAAMERVRKTEAPPAFPTDGGAG
jgi:GTP-binding protein